MGRDGHFGAFAYPGAAAVRLVIIITIGYDVTDLKTRRPWTRTRWPSGCRWCRRVPRPPPTTLPCRRRTWTWPTTAWCWTRPVSCCPPRSYCWWPPCRTAAAPRPPRRSAPTTRWPPPRTPRTCPPLATRPRPRPRCWRRRRRCTRLLRTCEHDRPGVRYERAGRKPGGGGRGRRTRGPFGVQLPNNKQTGWGVGGNTDISDRPRLPLHTPRRYKATAGWGRTA